MCRRDAGRVHRAARPRAGRTADHSRLALRQAAGRLLCVSQRFKLPRSQRAELGVGYRRTALAGGARGGGARRRLWDTRAHPHLLRHVTQGTRPRRGPDAKLVRRPVMSALYPFLLRPEFVERPWGARHLSPVYPEHRCEKPVGEVWLTGDENRVANGPLAGRTLGELCREYGRALVGESARETDRFPLLIKFLFPREKLSVQVHPDDEAARRVGQPCGKTE